VAKPISTMGDMSDPVKANEPAGAAVWADRRTSGLAAPAAPATGATTGVGNVPPTTGETGVTGAPAEPGTVGTTGVPGAPGVVGVVGVVGATHRAATAVRRTVALVDGDRERRGSTGHVALDPNRDTATGGRAVALGHGGARRAGHGGAQQRRLGAAASPRTDVLICGAPGLAEPATTSFTTATLQVTLLPPPTATPLHWSTEVTS
jgi:hypothetical protein